MKFIFPFILTVIIGLTGCGNKFEECIQKQQEEYRASHPNAPYSEAARQRSGFEAMCSSFKDK